MSELLNAGTESFTQSTEPQARTIKDRFVIYSVKLRKLGIKRKVATNQITTDAAEEMVHVSKDILESPEYEDVKSLDGEIRTYLKRKTIPHNGVFAPGQYPVAIQSIETIDARMEQFAGDRAVLVRRFLTSYPDQVEAARGRLKSLYDPSEYPELLKVEAAFSMETKVITEGTPETLRTLNRSLYEREARKAEVKLVQAAESITQALRAQVAEFTDHLVDRLTPKPDGSTKVFRNTLVDSFREFLADFRTLNITDDAELDALVTRARQVIDGVTPDRLRDDSILRDRVRENFEQIKASLDPMLVEKPKRRIDMRELN